MRGRLTLRRLVDALVAADETQALAVVSEAAGQVGSRTAMFADVIQPAQHEIGELWYSGRIGVADEHRATAIIQAIVEGLPPTPSSSPVRAGTSCVLAAAGEEQHVLGLRVLELALEDEGWSVEQLGGRTPVPDLLALVGRRRPALVGLSAGYVQNLRPLIQAVDQLKAQRVAVIVGGAAFNRVPGLWRRLGADGHGVDARVSVVLARKLVGQ